MQLIVGDVVRRPEDVSYQRGRFAYGGVFIAYSSSGEGLKALFVRPK